MQLFYLILKFIINQLEICLQINRSIYKLERIIKKDYLFQGYYKYKHKMLIK